MKIRDLTDFFTTKQNKFKQYLRSSNHNQQPAHKQHNLKLINETASFSPATSVNLLKFIICKKIATLDKQLTNNIIIQFTRRTRLKQQKGRTEFDTLPEITKEKYHNFGHKILQWLTSEFTSPKLNKIVIDRLPEHKAQEQQVNLRITFYRQNHPRDLNLKVTPQIDNLKTVNLNQLIKRLKAINGLKLNLNYNSKAPADILPQLKEALNKIDNKQTVHKLFKCLIGFKPYYLLIAEPKPIIADFTKHKLPTNLKADHNQHQLTAHFNNDYHLLANITMNQQTPYLEIDFQTLPNELELLSF